MVGLLGFEHFIVPTLLTRLARRHYTLSS
jgi:hypothetical protein